MEVWTVSFMGHRDHKTFCASTLRRIISIYLGDYTNVAAVKDAIAIETSIGFTPAEGILSSTSCGDIDPTIVFISSRWNVFSGNNPFAFPRKRILCSYGQAGRLGRYYQRRTKSPSCSGYLLVSG